MRSFAYVNSDYIENDSRPQLVPDNPCYQPSVYDQVTSEATFSYQSFKVRPQQMNSIFLPQVSGSHSSVQYDQLLCNVNFQVYAVQNLDRNGLPY